MSDIDTDIDTDIEHTDIEHRTEHESIEILTLSLGEISLVLDKHQSELQDTIRGIIAKHGMPAVMAMSYYRTICDAHCNIRDNMVRTLDYLLIKVSKLKEGNSNEH